MKNTKPTQIEIINDLLSQMNEEDANKYMNYINSQDAVGINSMIKKYGYVYVTPISNIISDEMIGNLFGGKEDVIVPLLMDSLSNAAKEIKENSKLLNEKSISQVNSISELRALDESMSKKQSVNQYISTVFNEELNTIMKAQLILESAGCDYISSELGGVIDEMTIKLLLDKPLQAIKKKNIISNDRRKAGKGNINPHKSTAIEIMKSTWKKNPSASKNRMGEKLIEYFGKDVSGKNKVSSSSIKRWIKTNNLGPSIQASSPIDFSLVIRS
ncbi:hypothetical protein [Yersinia massiliensis]|uniref:hypothetical protein n=1 Tax=Yersinia massiliensis TaxID=419257 RepID=UPI0011A4B688|nr:hypothetical protein [Yersinia massiliensis]